MAKAKKNIVTGHQVDPGAVERPRVLKLNGVWVGIGGKVERNPKPPFSAYVIREATSEEYLELARRGCPLVKLVEDDF